MTGQLGQPINFSAVFYDLDGQPRLDLTVNVIVENTDGTILISSTSAPRSGILYTYTLAGVTVTTYGRYTAKFTPTNITGVVPPIGIVVENVVSAIDPLTTVETAAAVQSGLTAQGYTTGRAVYLDQLVGLIASITALPARVWDALGTSHIITGSMGKIVQSILGFVIDGIKVVYADLPLPLYNRLVIYGGDTYTVASNRLLPTWTLTNDWPADILSYIVTLQVRTTDKTSVLKFTTTCTVTISGDSTEAYIQSQITKTNADLLTLRGKGVYQFKLVATNGSTIQRTFVVGFVDVL